MPASRERLECFLHPIEVGVGVGSELRIENGGDDFVADPEILLRHLLEQENGLGNGGQPGRFRTWFAQDPGDLVALGQMNALELFLENVVHPIECDETTDGLGAEQQMVRLSKKCADDNQDGSFLVADDSTRRAGIPEPAEDFLDKDHMIGKERIATLQGRRVGVCEPIIRVDESVSDTRGGTQLRPMIGNRSSERCDSLRRVRFPKQSFRDDVVDVVRAEPKLLGKAIRQNSDARPGLMESPVNILRGLLPGHDQEDFTEPDRFDLLGKDLKLGDPVNVVTQVEPDLVEADNESALLGMDRLRLVHQPANDVFGFVGFLLGQPHRGGG